MTSSLANIYAILRRKYGESCIITYAAPTSYLVNITDAKEADKVVFLYEEDRNKAKAFSFVSPSKLKLKLSPESVQPNLDLTGSPLKDDCVVDAIDDISIDFKLISLNSWTLEEEHQKGISVEKARSIICSEEFQDGDSVGRGSVWFLCNAADTEKTLLLQYEFNNRFFSRGIVTFLGVVPTSIVNSPPLLQHHFTVIQKGTSVETSIENTYYIKPDIALRCSWSTTNAVPSLTDLSSCDVTLKQTFRLKACGPITQDFMNQLRILLYIRDDILAYKKENTSSGIEPTVVYRCGRGIDMEELRESITKMMTDVSGFAAVDVDGSTECDLEAVVYRAKLRNLSDLTDKLWEILKCCSSYKDLKMGFNILFQCAARCNIVNTPTNKNRLAEIITEVANRRLAIPCLTGTEPLELLLEIGMEKLYKDYEFIFTESKICSANDLKSKSTFDVEESENVMPNVRKSLHNAIRPASATSRKTLLHNHAKGNNNKFQNDEGIGFKNSNFNEKQSAEFLAKLLQIHCALEHLLMIHIHLNLSTAYNDVCEKIFRKPPRIVDTIDESLTDEMEVTLSTHEVRELLEGKDPHSRRITMISNNKYREVKSMFFYCMDNVCPPSISEFFHTDDKELVKENTYFSWLYRKIKTLK